MKTIDLNKQLLDLDGNEINNPENKLSKILAGLFLSQKGGDAVKLFDWAVELNKNGKIEVDDSDFEKIKQMVKSDDKYFMVISKAQIIKALNSIDK